MAVDFDKYDGLLNHLYGASLDGGGWDNFCAALGDTFGRSVAWGIQGLNFRGCPTLDVISVHYGDDFMQSFRDYYHHISPWNPPLARISLGTVVTTEEVLPRERLMATEFYNDWVLPQENILAGCALALYRDAQRSMIVTSNIRDVDEDHLLPEVKALLERLKPHIFRTVKLAASLEHAALVDRRYIERFEAAHAAVFLLDAAGRVAYANPAAERLLAGRTELGGTVGRVLDLADKDATDCLEAGLRAIADGRPDDLKGDFAVRRRNDMPLAATLAPLRLDEEATGWTGDFLAAKRPVAILTLIDPCGRRALRVPAFAGLFGLTRAEASLAAAIARGHSPTDVATMSGTTINTVRTQLKSVLAKTGTQRQGELVALLNQFPDPPA